MLVALTHSPSQILRQLLILQGMGSEPGSGGLWPIFATTEPDSPDNCITIFDTSGLLFGRTSPDMEMLERHGIQIRIRSVDHPTGWQKADSIAIALDKIKGGTYVLIDGVNYCISTFRRTTRVIVLGMNVPNDTRRLFTINGVVNLSLP